MLSYRYRLPYRILHRTAYPLLPSPTSTSTLNSSYSYRILTMVSYRYRTLSVTKIPSPPTSTNQSRVQLSIPHPTVPLPYSPTVPHTLTHVHQDAEQRRGAQAEGVQDARVLRAQQIQQHQHVLQRNTGIRYSIIDYR